MSLYAYAAYSKNDGIRQSSSSGGLFSEFADYVYSIKGFVAGAAFDEDCKTVSHILTESNTDLPKLVTSKYVQSSFNIHKEIEEKLKDGKFVLCCGTPCQIAGLKTFLKCEYDNLYAVDFICHGTPLQKVWEKYANWQEAEHNGKITSVNFRSKENGWENYSLSISFDSRNKYSALFYKDLYMRLFLDNLSLNKNCFDCKFKGENRKSDITLGDFWGIDEELQKMNDDKGISVVLINTEKGNELFEKIKSNLAFQKIDENQATRHNLSAVSSVKKPENYEAFMNDLDKAPFEELAKYLPKTTLKQWILRSQILKMCIKIKRYFLG